MLRFLADENFNGDILNGLLARLPYLDVVRVQDTTLSSAADPEVLAWAAREDRVLLTHDAATMTAFAYDRVRHGLPMPGVFEVSRSVPIRTAIEDLALIAGASLDNEWEGQVRYLPLR